MISKIQTSFGNTVRRIRLSKGLSQEAFADLCELHRTYISDVELGKRNISIDNIEKIAKALNVNISDIFVEVEKNASV